MEQGMDGTRFRSAGLEYRRQAMAGKKSQFAALVAAIMVFPNVGMAQENDFIGVELGTPPQTVPLDGIIGKAPKTVFIPGRLYRNGEGALFIDGQRFATSNGTRDVASFIAGKDEYLIAVRANVADITEKALNASTAQQAKPLFSEDELRRLPPDMRLKALQAMGTASPSDTVDVKFGNGKPNATVFYHCSSATSCTIARVVKGLPALHTTERTLRFNLPSQNQRVGREVTAALLSYSGIDINGQSLDGPTGVLYAAPLRKNEWMIKKLTREVYAGIEYSWMIRSADGTERALFTDTDRSNDTLRIIVPSSIVIDQTPVSPSAAYGTLSVYTGGFERLWSETRLYAWPVCATSATSNRLHGTPLNVSPNYDVANFVSAQLAVILVEGKVQAFGQAQIKDRPLSVVDVDCENGVFPEKGVDVKPYASLDAKRFLPRMAAITTTSGGFVHVKSPNGNLILLTTRLSEGSPLPGILIEGNKKIEAIDVKRFLDRYGIAFP